MFVRSASAREARRTPPKPSIEVQEALSFEKLRIDVGNWHVMQHMFALAFDDDIPDNRTLLPNCCALPRESSS